jgi:formylglycine-generating enzyme required for sulfatase activity
MSDGNSIRVFRGGSCDDFPQYARVAYRSSSAPGNRYTSLGIRLVEEVEEVDEDQTPASWSCRASLGRDFRGGSWCGGPQDARVASRSGIAPGYRSFHLGVRLVEVTDV